MPRNTFIDAIVNTSGYKILSKQLCGVAVGLILVGFVWHLFDKSFSAPMCAGFLLLAILFFFKAFESVSETDNDVENASFLATKAFSIFANKMFWWSASVLSVAIEFLISHWPNEKMLLIVGLFTFIIGLVLKLLNINALRQR